MAQWVAFSKGGQSGFGQVVGDHVMVYEGGMFAEPRNTGTEILLTPSCAAT